jgi:hypothetical protein
LARIKAEKAAQAPVKGLIKKRAAGRKAATSRGAAGKA